VVFNQGPREAGGTTGVNNTALRRLMIDGTSISAIAAELGASWHTVSSIAMRATADLVIAAGPDRMAGVRVIGVDEHGWAPRRVGEPSTTHPGRPIQPGRPQLLKPHHPRGRTPRPRPTPDG